MSFCSSCGNELQDAAQFCSKCGAKVAIAIPNSSEKARRAKVRYSSHKETAQGDFFDAPEQLEKYIKTVVELEKSVFTQEHFIEGVLKNRDTLGKAQNLQRPLYEDHTFNAELYVGAVQIGFFAAIIGGIIGLFAGNFLKWAMWSGGIVAVGIILFLFICDMHSSSECNKRFEQKLVQYKQDVKDDALRVEHEKKEQESIDDSLSALYNKKQETTELLKKYYDIGLIYPKYQNLVAMCSFYEYFSSGRCTTLTGHEGAYNIYENEVRLDRICTKLDDVMEQLEIVKKNQFYLYDAIQEGNRLSEKLIEESVYQSRLLENISENAEVSAYYSKIAANNAAAAAWIGLANHAQLDSTRRALLE